MRTLSIRGFLSAVATTPLTPKSPVPHSYLREIMARLEVEPIREIAIYKGRSVGATVGVLENAIGYFLEHPEELPAPPLPKWVTEDTKAQLHSAVSYIDQYREQLRVKPRARNVACELLGSPSTLIDEGAWLSRESDPVADLKRLAELIRGPRQRPDLVVIDGIGYGPSEPLPPPFGDRR